MFPKELKGLGKKLHKCNDLYQGMVPYQRVPWVLSAFQVSGTMVYPGQRLPKETNVLRAAQGLTGEKYRRFQSNLTIEMYLCPSIH